MENRLQKILPWLRLVKGCFSKKLKYETKTLEVNK